ncbi:MAG: hypothetical protein IJU79_05270 [Desulfovibrionaceae bacterium]|nr:hypothetical protein [Desulfovibrionaceae bacterium]
MAVLVGVCTASNVSGLAAAEYGLTNVRPQSQEAPTPDTVVLLPSGQTINPWVTLPEEWLVTHDGNVVTAEGLILKPNGTLEYPFGEYPEGYVRQADGSIKTPEGFVIRPNKVKRGATQGTIVPKGAKILADGTVVLPDGTKIARDGTKITPDGTKIAQDGTKIAPDGTKIAPDGTKIPAQVHTVQPKETIVAHAPNTPTQLWSMLPLTEVPNGERKPVTQVASQTPKPVTPPKREDVNTGKQPAKPIPDQVKPQPKPAQVPVKPQPKPTPVPVKPQPKPIPKPTSRIGEPLRIPPEAVRTGNLDFLEGCWQGTRPEYYSKRTIYECFCFGKNGNSGRRRVVDPQGHRQCLGATRANLNSSGVLRVSSQGAYCSDGERWGQAEMTCRGQGQNTPCSWVFKDAQGGRQAYQIPFVRVESCRRR